MMILEMPCNPANYGGLRGEPVRYLVVHYTAGRNDTAENNGIYFGRDGGAFENPPGNHSNEATEGVTVIASGIR